jgi:osmotically-inducible protein OsmY
MSTSKTSLIFMLSAGLLIAIAGSSGCSSRIESTPVQYASSTSITFQVKEKFLRDPKIKSYSITVSTYRDTVTLGGYVRSQAEEERAIDLTRSVKGVKYVVDNMAIKNS